MLDNLIYLDGVVDHDGRKVEDIVDSLLKSGLENNETIVDGKIKYPGQMTRTEWETILKAIKNDPRLAELTVENGNEGFVYDSNGNQIMGEKGPLQVGDRMATFVDPKGNATVVFRGTSGDIEWHDNGMGGYLSDTEMQKRALEYIQGLDYTNITVTGHSKGGNKAQYVGILSDKVDRVLSLDGQGFSKEFFEKYEDLIAQNRDKITSISAESDYVNCLLIPLAEGDQRIYIDTEYQTDFLRNHSPGIVLDENGQLRDPAEQGAIPRLVNDLTIYLNANMEEPDRSYVMDGLLALLESGKEGFPKESADHTKQSFMILLPYLGDYLVEKAAQGSKDFGGLLLATLGAIVMPKEFMDDFLRYLKINIDNVGFVVQLAKEIGTILGTVIVEKLAGFLADMALKIRDKAKEIAAGIADFALKIKAGWDALVQGIGNFMEDLKNAGIAAWDAVNRFKDKVFQGVKDFGNWVAEGTKKAIESVKSVWNSSVDKVKGWLGEAKQKITNAVEGLKDGVKRVAELTKEGFNKFVDASVAKAKEIGNWFVSKLDQARDKIRELGSQISAAFTAFTDKLKEGWESLKAGAKSLAEKAKNTAVQAYEAIAQFGQNLIQTMKSFCENLKAAFKRALDGLKKAWDFTVDKVKGFFGWTKDKITDGITAVKDGIQHVATVTKDGFNKFVDASVTKAKEVGNWLVSKLEQAKDTAKQIGAKISATFTAFADKLKEGWESLKTGMKNLAESAKNTAIRASEAIAKFAQTLGQTVKSFCAKLASAFKQMLDGVRKTWDKVVDKVTDLFGKVKSSISLKINEYKDNMKSMVTLTRDKVKNLGKQAYKGVKEFTGKVVKGMSKISGGLLMVSVDRLSDLQTKFKRMDDDIVSTTDRIASDADRIASGVSRAYSESNVQSQIRQLQKAIDDVRNRSRRVAAEMQRKIGTIGLAREQYVKIEQMVKNEIKNLG